MDEPETIELAPAAEIAPPPAGLTAEELAAVRELALRAHPDAVPELVQGASLAELLASVEPARAAYQRIAAAIMPAPAAVPPSVPAGGAPRAVVDPDLLPPSEKIRRGLGRSSQ